MPHEYNNDTLKDLGGMSRVNVYPSNSVGSIRIPCRSLLMQNMEQIVKIVVYNFEYDPN
jgi:hypothetical protein